VDAALFDYDLPVHAIAQHPVEPRSSARLLVALDDDPMHATVGDLPSLIRPGDVVVVNETRVLPARLALRRPTGGAAEVLLLEPVNVATGEWQALVRPGRRLKAGEVLSTADGTPVIEIGERLAPSDAPSHDDDGRRCVRLVGDATPEAFGTIPLPPYITEPLADPERYQTVYARLPGSVAAPTAGLHLTHQVLGGVAEAGGEVWKVELAVGLGTFRPISAAAVEDHVMHEERYRVPEATMDACRRASRVIAIGTTSVRALESAGATGRLEGRTDLFIRPGYEFNVVDVLLTNFHQPRSSLLVLLAAFAGVERWRNLYDTALAEGYRFLSFGDAMIVDRERRR